MAALPQNLERHPTVRRRWIAYDGGGFAFRVRWQGGRYLASPSHLGATTDGRRFTGRTLATLAAAVGASSASGEGR